MEVGHTHNPGVVDPNAVVVVDPSAHGHAFAHFTGYAAAGPVEVHHHEEAAPSQVDGLYAVADGQQLVGEQPLLNAGIGGELPAPGPVSGIVPLPEEERYFVLRTFCLLYLRPALKDSAPPPKKGKNGKFRSNLSLSDIDLRQRVTKREVYNVYYYIISLRKEELSVGNEMVLGRYFSGKSALSRRFPPPFSTELHPTRQVAYSPCGQRLDGFSGMMLVGLEDCTYGPNLHDIPPDELDKFKLLTGRSQLLLPAASRMYAGGERVEHSHGGGGQHKRVHLAAQAAQAAQVGVDGMVPPEQLSPVPRPKKSKKNNMYNTSAYGSPEGRSLKLGKAKKDRERLERRESELDIAVRNIGFGAMDLWEDEDYFYLCVDCPGLQNDDVKIQLFTTGELIITAIKPRDSLLPTSAIKNVFCSRSGPGEYEWKVNLPTAPSTQEPYDSCVNLGVLSIRIRKVARVPISQNQQWVQ
eukprot:jgi/Chlat1/570/Chrsp103S01136